jgi:integrase
VLNSNHARNLGLFGDFRVVKKTLEVLLSEANKRLKAGHVGVTVYYPAGRGKLYLQGIFPPKTDSNRTEPYQQKFTLGLPANEIGLKLAEAKAKEVGSLITQGRFRWQDFLKADPIVEERKTCGYWVKAFEKQYFECRARTTKTESTWHTNYVLVFNQLQDDGLLSTELMRNVILAKTDADSRQRLRYCLALAALGKLAGLDVTAITTLKGHYSSSKTSERNLPSDADILAIWKSINHAPEWLRWSFGILACYGLRPHELYHLDLSDFKKGDIKIRILDDTKTGSRVVWPLVPEGFDLDCLRKLRPPTTQKTGISNQELGGRIGTGFKSWDVGVLPYDLRHAWAVRAIRRGLDVSAATRMMGHSLSIHNKTYQRWLTDADLESAYRRSLRP